MTGVSDPVAIGIDVGGTHVRAALVGQGGQIIKATREALDTRTPSGVIDRLVALRDAVGGKHHGLPIGVGLAAQIWVRDGTVAVAPNLGWRNVPLGALLNARFGRPVRLVNDLNAIAAGEAACGAGEGAADVVCVFVGTGVGMGAVVHGRILEGADGLATELGHVKVGSLESGRLCGCGDRGCLEAYTSGRHLPERLVEMAVERHAATPLSERAGRDAAGVTADHIETAAVAGDSLAQALWDDVAALLGRQIAAAVKLLNPRVVVLGGGVFAAAPTLHERTLQQIQRHLSAVYRDHTQIRVSRLGDHAGVIGAALLAGAQEVSS